MYASKTDRIREQTMDVNKSGINCTDFEIDSDSVRFKNQTYFNGSIDNINYISWLTSAF